VIQLWCSIYLGVFLMYLLVAGGAALLMLHGWQVLRTIVGSVRVETMARLGGLVGSLLLSLCAAALLMLPYRRATIDYGFGPRLTEIATMLPRPMSYLLADTNAFYGQFSHGLGPLPMRQEHQLFFGVAISIALVAGIATTFLAPRWRRLGLFAIISLGILVLATLSVGGFSLYWGLTPIPGIGAIRAVSRVVLVMLLPAAILAGLGVQGMVDWLQPRSRAAAMAAALAVVLVLPVETVLQPLNHDAVATWRQRLAELRARLPEPIPNGAILFVTSNSPGHILSEIDAMLLAQELGIPTLNGYSGSGPRAYGESRTCVTAEQRLAQYAFERQVSLASVAPLVARTVTVERQPCVDAGKRVVRVQPLGPSVAPLIGLSITDLRWAGGKLIASVAVENRSSQRLDPFSASGQSLKLSWRFVPEGQVPDGPWTRIETTRGEAG